MRRLLSLFLILAFVLPAPSSLGQSSLAPGTSGRAFIRGLQRDSHQFGVTELPMVDIYLRESCESQVSVGGTVDQKVRYLCNVVMASDSCTDVPARDRKDCRRPGVGLELGWDFVSGCLEGAFNSVRGFLSFLVEAASFIWDNLTDVSRRVQSRDRASEFLNSIRMYIHTEYDRAYDRASFPRGLNASRVVAQNMLSFLGRQLFDMVKDSYLEFGCLNPRAQSEMLCRVITDFVVPPAAFFAFLKRGAMAANISRSFGRMRNFSRLRPYLDRLRSAGRVLNRTLTGPQEEAVVRAHLVGAGEIVNGRLAGAGNYSLAHIRRKAEILREAGFSSAEIRRLMENSIVGLDAQELRNLASILPAPAPAARAVATPAAPAPAAVARAPAAAPISVAPGTHQNLHLAAHADQRYETVRRSLRQGEVPAERYISYEAPGGSRLAARIEGVNPSNGEITLVRPSGERVVLRDGNSLRVSAEAESQFARATHPSLKIEDHAEEAYGSVRRALRAGEVPTDPYISFETPTGARWPGRIESVDHVSGEVTITFPDGTSHILRGEELASLRTSTTSRSSFANEGSRITLAAHPERNYAAVRDALNRGQAPESPYVSFEAVSGQRLPARIESVDGNTGIVRVRLGSNEVVELSGHELESLRLSDTARMVFDPRPIQALPVRSIAASANDAFPALVVSNSPSPSMAPVTPTPPPLARHGIVMGGRTRDAWRTEAQRLLQSLSTDENVPFIRWRANAPRQPDNAFLRNAQATFARLSDQVSDPALMSRALESKDRFKEWLQEGVLSICFGVGSRTQIPAARASGQGYCNKLGDSENYDQFISGARVGVDGRMAELRDYFRSPELQNIGISPRLVELTGSRASVRMYGDLEANYLNTGNSWTRFYADADLQDKIFTAAPRRLAEAMNSPTNAGLLEGLSDYYHMMSHSRPFREGNNSLFMAQVNAVLNSRGMRPVSQHMLDHMAHSMDYDQFRSVFRYHVEQGLPETAQVVGATALNK